MVNRGWTWKKWLLLAGACIAGWWLWTRIFDGDQTTKRLVNQVWIERMPRDERDMIWGGVLVEHDGRRVGVVGRGSRWRLHQDLFVWRLQGDRLHTRFPQDGHHYQLAVKTWECEGKAPKPFQLCLELRRGDRVLRFYSHKDWVVRPGVETDLPRELAGLIPPPTPALPSLEGQEVGEEPETAGPSPFEQ